MKTIKERILGYAEEWRTLRDEQIDLCEYISFDGYVEEQEAQLEARLAADIVEHLREFE